MKINLQLLDGKHLSVIVSETTSVFDLKRMVCAQTGLAVEEQTLFLQGQTDEKALMKSLTATMKSARANP